MAKRCVPGVICIENLTMTLLIIIISIVLYIVYLWQKKDMNPHTASNNRPVIINPYETNNRPQLINQPPEIMEVYRAEHAVPVIDVPLRPSLNNPYIPPLKTDGIRPMIPVNVETRGLPTGYTQIGILTNDGVILPLMGRRTMMGRDKWQYYTVTTTGNMNTKLPVRVNGKSGMSEYGCDEIYDGDSVYVDGYNEMYRATIYENATLRYL